MNPDFKTGGVSRPKDKRDFQLGQYQAPVEIPTSYVTDISQVKRLYQASWPACGAHAGAHFKEIQEGGGAFSPDFLWTEIKKIDGFPPEVGTDIRSIMKTLLNKGVCDYDLLPNNYNLGLYDYSHATITQQMYDNAKAKGISAYAFNDFPTIQELKQAIYQNKVVLALIWMDIGFFGTKNPTFTLSKYGHFIVFYGYDNARFFFLDSTEKDLEMAAKVMPINATNFVREIATAIDLPNHFIFKNDLRILMRNEEVRELQRRIGMIPENQTGYFGPITFLAVQKYQRDHQILATGFVGPLTRASLNKG